MMTAAEVHPGWRTAGAAIALAFALLGVVFADSFAGLAALWNDSDSYGHGVFVVPISLYAVWVTRHQVLALRPRPWWPAMVALAGCSLGWALASALSIEVGEQLALVCMLALVVLALGGLRVGWALAFPLAYLLLAVPVWDLLVPPLQLHTAIVTTTALRAFGVPIFLEGFYISIPSGQFEIAEVCAGLRYLMAMASIAAFYAFLNRLTLRAGIAFFCLALVWAVLFNWVRVVGIVAVGHVSEMQSSLVHDHYMYGWVMFAVALLPLFYAGRWFPYHVEPDVDDGRPGAATAPAPDQRPARPATGTVLATLLVAALAIGAGPLAQDELLERQPPGPFEFDWPARPTDGWQRVDGGGSPLADWQSTFRGAAWQGSARYADERGDTVQAYGAVYGREVHGAELINVRSLPYDPDRWTVLRSAVRTDAPAAFGGQVREVQVRNDAGHRRVIWYLYRAGGDFHVSPLRGKLAQLTDLLDGRPAGAVLALAVEGGVGLDAARERLARAGTGILPAMLAQLRTESVL